MRVRKAFVYLILTVLISVVGAVAARAQGVIVPRPCGRCPAPPPIVLPRALPIKSIKIDTRIAGQVATTHVEQIFRNDTDATLEGTYLFPIPEAASISEFAIWEGGRRLIGEVRSREEARRIYDEIVRRQRDPGLLEYAGRDLFQASIFPIPPRSDKKLELTYTQVLRGQGTAVSYRYPLGTGHNLAPIGTVAGSIEIEAREPLRNIYSPSHKIDIVRPGQSERRARISFEAGGEGQRQDFQLFYGLSTDDFGLSLVTHRAPGREGYFLLMLSPKEHLAEEEYAAKDIVFVIDTSGSMAAEGKMEKARGALLFGVRTLRPADRFNIISFAGEEHLMAGNLVAADAAGRARGQEFIERLRPVGGTNINGALLAALRQFEMNDRPRLIVFMTDGLPTVGESAVQRIIENAAAARTEGTRLFTFGVGYDVNTALLDKLAAENGGTADYVEPKEDIETKVSDFFTKVNYPVLTGLRLDTGEVEIDLFYPRTLPDLFRGSQLALVGRYRNKGEARNVTLRLTGRTGSGSSRTFAYPGLSFPVVENEHEFLPRLWATRRVGWLMEQITSNGEQQELRDEVVDLGTRYGIVTPYTSFLAIESEAPQQITGVDNSQTGAGRARELPVARRGNNDHRRMERAASGGGSGLPPAPPGAIANAPIAATSTTGEVAVKQSINNRAQQEAVTVAADMPPNVVRNVGGKTFYLRDGIWIDAEFRLDARLPETALVFGSDRYFALLKREPRLGEFFALGERVIVVYEKQVYRVTGESN